MNRKNYYVAAWLVIVVCITWVMVYGVKKEESFEGRTVIPVKPSSSSTSLSSGKVNDSPWLLDDIYSVNPVPSFHYHKDNEVLGGSSRPNQTTNNERNPSNPDNGTCTPMDVCGVYLDRK